MLPSSEILLLLGQPVTPHLGLEAMVDRSKARSRLTHFPSIFLMVSPTHILSANFYSVNFN
jgi:hypothetical protein